MIVRKVRNVNEAFYDLVHDEWLTNWRTIAPRDGQVTLEALEPVCTVYMQPTERVLFSPYRDVNPFFHWFEALWILAGQKDVESMSYFNRRMVDYSDDTKYFHAAYGYRLRNQFSIDQIETAIAMLHKNPDTRRCVMQIFAASLDLGTQSKDIPCNDLVMLKIRDEQLHISVHCRSNDALWGAYGTNAVQFSMLQEYIARAVGVAIGEYRQISDSFHVYVDNETWKTVAGGPTWPLSADYYLDGTVSPMPLFEMHERNHWDVDNLNLFHCGVWNSHYPHKWYPKSRYFAEAVRPALIAWKAYKDGDIEAALAHIEKCAASDWRVACTEWLKRRRKR